MSYPDVLDTSKTIDDLLSRKEFAQLHVDRRKPQPQLQQSNPSFLSELLAQSGQLFLHPQQKFFRNFMSPHTPFKRLLGKHDTGTGKTNGALMCAFEFVRLYRQQFDLTHGEIETPLVFIIGFSKSIFQAELLRRPEFGFVTPEEIREHKRLQYLAENGTQADHDAMTEFESRLKKRLSKKTWNGFFKFIGYKEFFNRLFTFAADFSGRGEQSEEAILAGIKAGAVTINLDLVKAFANSLVICDEVHNVYNSIEINNYGIALRTLFNIYDIPDEMGKYIDLGSIEHKNQGPKVLFLTATPINNNPTEVVDLINLLVPQSQLPNRKKIEKNDWFVDDKNLRPGALEQIQRLTRGYISFFRNPDPKYFPQRIMEGEPLKIPGKYLKERVHGFAGTTLPYLKFVICRISPLHYRTYQTVYTGTLPPDGQSLLDMVLPNPEIIEKTVGLGLFRTKDIRHSLQNAPQKWKDKYQIDLIKQEKGPHIITGEFMRVDDLGQYSTKYHEMIKAVFKNLQKDQGKILIVHQYVKMSGILFIQEVLRRNGIIDEYSNPTDNTLCSKCGIGRAKHRGADHDFIPARFIYLSGELDPLTKARNIEKFNSAEDPNGYNYRILLGSKVANEGIDLMAVQNIWIMSVPPDIPTLLQILGRAIRNRSHVLLPPEKRKVRVKIFVSALPAAAAKSEFFYEEYKYFESLMNYIIIQRIEKILNSNAIDSPLYHDVIFPPGLFATPSQNHEPDLGTLYFDVAPIFGKKWLDVARGREIKNANVNINTATFDPYFSSEEIQTIMFVIRRLFIEQSTVWTYDDLWAATRQPPFDVHVNAGLFLEDNFILALSVLCPAFFGGDDTVEMSEPLNQRRALSLLLDPTDSRLIHKGVECKIAYHEPYFMLLPTIPTAVRLSEQDEYSLNTLGRDTALIASQTVAEPDTWYRRDSIRMPEPIRITEVLRTSNISYSQMKYKFYNQFVDTPIEEIPTTVELYDLDFHVHLVEDAIRYVFNIYTNPAMPFSELHTFYFKILYFYDQLDMILFADQVRDTKLFEHYAAFVSSEKKLPYRGPDKSLLPAEHGYDAFLMSSISKSQEQKPFNIGRLNAFLGKHPSSPRKYKHLRLEDMNVTTMTKPKKIAKVFGNLLPVGHFLTTNLESTRAMHVSIPKIYIPGNEGNPPEPLWRQAAEFSSAPTADETENDLIIGYYEKNPFGIDVKFKLRPPVQRIEYHDDLRTIERGSACNTRHKDDLFKILELLKIDGDANSIKDICGAIKLELMRREMNERQKWKKATRKKAGKIDEQDKKPKRIRWFYLHFEKS